MQLCEGQDNPFAHLGAFASINSGFLPPVPSFTFDIEPDTQSSAVCCIPEYEPWGTEYAFHPMRNQNDIDDDAQRVLAKGTCRLEGKRP
jgi:hypothetical protein